MYNVICCIVNPRNGSFEKKRKKLTDMYLDDKISKEAYDDKYSELGNKLDKCEEE